MAQLVKNLPAVWETWVRKIPWRREQLHTPVFWPGEFHGVCIIHGVAKSGTWLSNFHFTFYPDPFLASFLQLSSHISGNYNDIDIVIKAGWTVRTTCHQSHLSLLTKSPWAFRMGHLMSTLKIVPGQGKSGKRWHFSFPQTLPCQGPPKILKIEIACHLLYDPEKAMAPHSSTLAWKIPWTEEPVKLQSMGSLRVRHDWATSLSLFTFMHWRRKWQPTPAFLPGESQGQGSLVGCRLWGRTESETTEVT